MMMVMDQVLNSMAARDESERNVISSRRQEAGRRAGSEQPRDRNRAGDRAAEHGSGDRGEPGRRRQQPLGCACEAGRCASGSIETRT